jgi:hypothetical protein
MLKLIILLIFIKITIRNHQIKTQSKYHRLHLFQFHYFRIHFLLNQNSKLYLQIFPTLYAFFLFHYRNILHYILIFLKYAKTQFKKL